MIWSYKKNHMQMQDSRQHRLTNFSKRGWKEKIWRFKHLVQKQLCCLRLWCKKIWSWLLWGKPSLIFQKNPTKSLFLAFSVLQVSLAMNQLHCLAVKQLCTGRKMSTDTLMNEMQPIVLVNKTFESEEKAKVFGISGIFGPWALRC